MSEREVINRLRASRFRNRDRFTTRRPVDPDSSQSVAGQVAAQTPYTPPMPQAQWQAEQRRQYDALQQRPRPVEAYQDPRNQFAEAGEYGLEMTGLPSIRRSAGAFADNRPREGFEEGALGLLGVTTLGVGGRGARAPRPMPDAPPRPPTRVYRGIVPDESRRSALGDRWWSDNPETASTYAPAAADGAHVVPGLLDESGVLAVEAPPGTMFRSIPVSSLPPEIRRAFPRTTQTVSTHEVAAAAEAQGFRGVTFSGIRDGGYGGGPEPYGGFQTGDDGRVIAVFDDSTVQSPFPTGGALRPPARPMPDALPMRAPVAEPSGALRRPSARIARPGEIEQAGGAYTSDDVRYPHEFADDPGAAAAYEIPDATNVNRGPRRPLLMPPRQLGTASDGSVMPVRPPEPFRQSMVGGSDDLAEAARPGALRPADGSSSAGGGIRAYHGSADDIDSFRPGSHFGTSDAANQRLRDNRVSDGGRVYPVDLPQGRYLRVPEAGGEWGNARWWQEQARGEVHGGPMPAEERALWDAIESDPVLRLARGEEVNRRLAEIMREHGFEGAIYRNRWEGGESYFLPDASRARMPNDRGPSQ